MPTSAIEIPGYVAGTWDIDPVHSHIGFIARHMMLSKVRGRFEKFEGQIVTTADPMQSSATLTVDMNSVNTGDQTRDDDLRPGRVLRVRRDQPDGLRRLLQCADGGRTGQ